MTNLEETYQRITSDNIDIVEYDFDKIKGLVVNDAENYYIGINKSLSDIEKRFVCEHEYSHILTNSLYYMESTRLTKLRRETKANDNMIERLNLVELILPLIKNDASPYEVENTLGIPNHVFWLTINYMKRKRII